MAEILRPTVNEFIVVFPIVGSLSNQMGIENDFEVGDVFFNEL